MRSLHANCFRGSRWLITGGTGFLAANFARSTILEPAEVHLTIRNPNAWRLAGLDDRFHFHLLDLRDESGLTDLFSEVQPDFVVHTATWRPSTGDDRRAAVMSNIIAANNLIEAALAHPPCRLVHLGSSLEYGRRDIPLREDMELLPDSIHGAAKATASLLLRQAAWADGLRAVILRCFHVYGPWERRDRLLSTAIRAIRDGLPVKLTEPGPVRDLTYVDDVIEAVLLSAANELDPGEVVNIGSGIETSNEDLVQAIGSAMGKKPIVHMGSFPPRSTDSPHWVADTTRARERLGWTAATSLASGLSRTVDWVLKHESQR